MDWGVLLQQAPSGGMTYLGWLASGTMWTLLVSIAAWIIAFTLGSMLGVLRTTPLRIPRAIATAYVELFRNVPLLVQMFLWYFVMPEVIPKAWGDWIKTELPNLVELPFGRTLRELIEDFGGGTASGRPLRAVQVGGPLGAYLSADELDTPLDYEAFAARGAMLGHGGVVVFDDRVDMAAQARFAMEFCAAESCGKCTPCRIGAVRGVEVIDRIRAGTDRDRNLILLRELCETMELGSLCAMGGLTPMPVRSALDKFPQDFGV